MIGLDFETTETTALTPGEGRIRLVQASDGNSTLVFDPFKVDPMPLFVKLANERVVAHNANLEELWLWHEFGIDLPGVMDDTMVMSQVLYSGTENFKRIKHGLADVAKRELGVDLDKTEQESDWSGELTDAQLAYAAKDAEILLPLAERLLSRLHDEGLMETYFLEAHVRPAVDAMERYGVAVHKDRLEALIADATQRAEALKDELAEEWGINPGSGKQLIEHFRLEGRPGWPRTKGGKPSTDQEAMKLLLAEEPSIERWIKWKEIEKIRSTYGNSILKKLSPDGRLRARFNPFGTATGRFSSSGPNLQNIPKGPGTRGLFWSGGDDRVLIKADYASIELWLAAIRWKDPYMQEALQQGVNMHVVTAAALYNIPAGEVTKEQKAVGKIVNFALLYGGSSRRILEEFEKRGIPIDEEGAVEIHHKFFETYKGFKRRKDAAKTSWNASEYDGDGYHEARTAIGRSGNFAEWYGPLLNHEIQGTGADGIKFALARMHEIRGGFPAAQPVLTVHDEIVEASEYQKEEVAEWVRECMVDGMLDALAQEDRDDVPSLPTVEIEIAREWS